MLGSRLTRAQAFLLGPYFRMPGRNSHLEDPRWGTIEALMLGFAFYHRRAGEPVGVLGKDGYE